MSPAHLLHLPVTVTVILILVYFSEMYGDDGSTSRHRRQDEKDLSMEEDEEYEEDLSSAVSDASEEDGHILWAEHDGNSP